MTFDELLKDTLRFRPDRIILGEVRGIEARTLLDSLNTGHTGSLATIHANSAEKALRVSPTLSCAVTPKAPFPTRKLRSEKPLISSSMSNDNQAAHRA